ncbi:MAG: DNA polymerase III subunit delta [Candidatus Omnitrophica bacterium]|nr:DNA polymerase III subunit delta [Candidatus Omnitrophota bacterium]
MVSHLILSDEPLLIRREIRRILEEDISQSVAESDRHEFYAGEMDSLADFLDLCKTDSLFAEHRLMVLQGLESLKAEESRQLLLNYLDAPHNNTTLALVMKEARPNGTFLKHLQKRCRTITLNRPKKKSEIVGWIRSEAQRRGVRLDFEAASLLSDRVGPDLVKLEGVLDQLACFAGEEVVVGDHVRALVAPTAEETGFALADALTRKDASEALRISARLFESGDRPVQLLGLLHWHWRRLETARKILLRGGGLEDVGAELKMKWYVDRLVRQARSLDEERMKRGFELLLRTDRSLKSSSAGDQLVWDRLIVELCR